MEGVAAILNDVNVWADNRDAIYIESDHFEFKSDDDFIILYGVNHEQTGKAIFSNASFYGDKNFIGVDVANTTVESKALRLNISRKATKTRSSIMCAKCQETLMKKI